jgi:hypothetical protein
LGYGAVRALSKKGRLRLPGRAETETRNFIDGAQFAGAFALAGSETVTRTLHRCGSA